MVLFQDVKSDMLFLLECCILYFIGYHFYEPVILYNRDFKKTVGYTNMNSLREISIKVTLGESQPFGSYSKLSFLQPDIISFLFDLGTSHGFYLSLSLF